MSAEERNLEWDDEEEDENALPPREESIGEDGIKTVVEYTISEDGYLKKTTTKSKVEKVTHRVPKGVAERRKWTRFGQCQGMTPGLERGISDVSADVISVEWAAQKDDDEEEEEDPMEAARKRASKEVKFRRMQQRMKERELGGAVVTSLQGGDRAAGQNWAQLMSERAANAANVGDMGGAGGQRGGATGARWVPKSAQNRLPNASEAQGGYQRDDSTTVRVSNVSANTTEGDLQELFRPFGAIKRIYLSRDRVTGESKGFAYVAFHNISHAQECIDKLNGYPYDHLILQIEWAKPSEQRTPQTQQFPGYTRA